MQSEKHIMQFSIFQQSIKENRLPANLSVYLQAMWYDALGDWDTAHHLINDLDDNTACWVHAYLHRKEGDLGNANYWYRRADKKMPSVSLQEEWEMIVQALL
jgi:hypothetical protein